MHVKGKMWRSVSTLLLAISMMMLASCTTVMVAAPKHCITKAEWPRYHMVAEQKSEVHKPGAAGNPTTHTEYAARVAWLEGFCKGVNAFRGE